MLNPALNVIPQQYNIVAWVKADTLIIPTPSVLKRCMYVPVLCTKPQASDTGQLVFSLLHLTISVRGGYDKSNKHN